MKWLLIGGAGVGLWWYLSRKQGQAVVSLPISSGTSPGQTSSVCRESWDAAVAAGAMSTPPGVPISQVREIFFRHCESAPVSAQECFSYLGPGDPPRSVSDDACLSIMGPFMTDMMALTPPPVSGFGNYVRG